MGALKVLVILLPAAGLLWLVWRSDREREPPAWVIGTAILGAVLGAASFYVRNKVTTFTHLDVDIRISGQTNELLKIYA